MIELMAYSLESVVIFLKGVGEAVNKAECLRRQARHGKRPQAPTTVFQGCNWAYALVPLPHPLKTSVSEPPLSIYLLPFALLYLPVFLVSVADNGWPIRSSLQVP